MRYRLKVATWMVVREGDEPSPHFLRTSADIARLALDLVRDSDDDREHFWALILDGKNRLKLAFQVSVGSLNASIVHPREVFGPALREGAAAIAIVHNHPSGDPTPSAEDIEVTHRLVRGGELLGIRVLDHVIVGNGTEMKWTSFQERGMLNAP
jgi:DNA repair protein RadC